MTRINCNIIKDLLPLYVDGVVSPESADAIRKHLEICKECRNEYIAMNNDLTLPVSNVLSQESLGTLKSFKRRRFFKMVLTACISAFLTLVLIIACVSIYRNVGSVHDFFSPSIHINLRNTDTEGTWQRIAFEGNDFLIFDSPFYSKEVVLDANSSGAAELRILDQSGNTLIESNILPGTGIELDGLKNNIPYSVEIRGEADFLLLNFY